MLVALIVVVKRGADGGLIGYYAGTPARFPGASLLNGWVRWDAGWYLSIAADGYSYAGTGQQSSVAFFPVYPLLIRLVHSMTPLSMHAAGIAVTIAAGATAVIVFHRWCVGRLGSSVARIATLTLVLYPYAFYLFGAVYADAVFLCAAVTAFWLLERDLPVWAGAVGAVASAARPVGVAVVLGLVAVTLMRRSALWAEDGRPRLALGRLRRRDAGVLLSAVGLAAWMAYLWRRFGDPLAFQAVQQAPGWGQEAGPRTWLKMEFFGRLERLPNRLADLGDPAAGGSAWEQLVHSSGLLVHAGLALACCGLLVVVWRRLGWGYAVYAGIVVAIAVLGSKDFQGVGRYMLAAFPCFAGAGIWLAGHRRIRVVWLPVSATLLVAWAFAFGRGYYVA